MTRRQSIRIKNKALGSDADPENSDVSAPQDKTQEPSFLTGPSSKKADENIGSPADTESDCPSFFVIDTKPGTSHSTLLSKEGESDVNDSETSDSDSESDEDELVDKATSEKGPKGLELASSLQPGISFGDTYLNVDTYRSPASCNKKIDKLLASKSSENELLQKSVFRPSSEKLDALPAYRESMNQLKKQRRKERSQTKGSGWFDMKAPELTEERKNEIRVLQMRRSLDPKRFYKAPDIIGIPKFFQTARIIDGPADFYNRVPKKDRKRTLVDELMADADFKKFSKRKIAEIQESKKHNKGAYKRMKRMKKVKK